jgi:voltage-gated potassium channel
MYGALSPTTDKKKRKERDNLETDALLPDNRPLLLKKYSVNRRNRMAVGNASVLDDVFSASDKRHESRREKRSSIANSEERRVVHSNSFVYTMLNPRSRQWQAVAFKSFISTIIITDLFLFIISTDETFYLNYIHYLWLMEGLVSFIFLVEYTARLVTITERKHYGKLGPICGRLSYMTTPGAVIDCLATLPFFLEICTGWNLPTLTYLRFFRLFRILKTEGYVRAIDAVYRVIYYNRQILYVAVLVCGFLVLLTAVLLYYLRPPADPDNADSFASIPATLYLSTLMLTGQGPPDGDLPWYTKSVILLTSVFSVAMFAIPASMLTWGFEAEAARCAKLSWRKANKNKNGNCSSSSSCSDYDNSSGGNSTDEEYFKIIAGEDNELEDDASKAWMKAQMLSFQKADVDNSGTISLREYLQMQSAKENEDDKVADGASRLQLETLEKKVNKNCEKLDRILELLEKR